MADNKEHEATQVRRLIPVPLFNKFHPDPTPSALRWMIFKNKDGFNRCVVRRGRRLLIDESEYFKWIEEHNASGKWN